MDQLTFARQVLDEQSFSRLIGARLTSFSEGAASMEIDADERLRQQYGLMHGGVIAYAVDNILGFTAGSVLGPSVLTSGLTINYLRPVRDGVLRAEGTVAHHNGRQAVCTVEVLSVAPDGTTELCAIAQGTVLTTQKAA